MYRRCSARTALWCGIVLACSVPLAASAQAVEQPDVSVAVTPVIAEQQVAYGDIITFDEENGVYRLAREPDDPNLYGVAVEQPLLVLRTATNTVPVLRSGQAFVNVTLQNGAIARGDFITASPVPGKGMRVREDDTNVLGVALEPFSEESEAATTTTLGETVLVGTIAVNVDVRGFSALAERRREGEGKGNLGFAGFEEATILNIIQYVVAAFIAVGSVYIAFRNFMPNINRGVISVGRNPRAKSSIQSMVLFNAFLILLVSAAGLFVALGVIFLPI